MKRLKLLTVAPLLTIALLLQACGGSFAQQLRVILAASTPLIDSLNLGDKRAAVIADFSELAGGAATLKESLDACADKPCKLNAVDAYERLFESVEAHGNFGSHQKLQDIERILRGIVEAARVYYGSSTLSRGATVSGESLDAQLRELKAAMKVK